MQASTGRSDQQDLKNKTMANKWQVSVQLKTGILHEHRGLGKSLIAKLKETKGLSEGNQSGGGCVGGCIGAEYFFSFPDKGNMNRFLDWAKRQASFCYIDASGPSRVLCRCKDQNRATCHPNIPFC